MTDAILTIGKDGDQQAVILNIPKVQGEHSGRITLIASNEYGADETAVLLDARGKIYYL